MSHPSPRPCRQCGTIFESRRTIRYCSDTCRSVKSAAALVRQKERVRGIHAVALDEAQVQRCADAYGDGVRTPDLMRRFGKRVYEAARKRTGTRPREKAFGIGVPV